MTDRLAEIKTELDKIDTMGASIIVLRMVAHLYWAIGEVERLRSATPKRDDRPWCPCMKVD